MGGRRHIRDARPTALLSAVATLLAALSLCLASVDPHHPASSPDRGAAAHSASAGITLRTDVAGTSAGRAAAPEYICPYERNGCRFVPHLWPAVLTAPHPADPPGTGEVSPARPAPLTGTGQVARSGASPRAPDLHVLQVLRT
ncbi:hypothetical protein OG875_23065 [Streptomyces sp. NBC_01498]|uniref:hypothetical protein n=1 Tax=Streptomyces sp. NBC_01498 TaxID=2975870 RepID=UPI002E7AC1F0|nr:hypothetical protein [Streptomyces sp. NBC_01498]WTL27194.1 hypothetical protein OG875_23065 [Streptomyces sp. NBC_01498]